MTVFDRYILREWLSILGLILCATIGLLVMQALYDSFRDLLDLHVGFTDMLLYYAVLVPSYFSIVLPISLLLSLLFVLGKLHRNNEIMAVRAAGLNIFGATRSLWLATIVFCGVSLLLNARVVPWAVEASNRLKEGFELRADTRKTGGGSFGTVTGIAFDNVRARRMWYINRYARFAHLAYGVTVSELDGRRRERTRLMAREARFDPERQAWVFRDGREMWFDPEAGELIRSVTFAEKTIPHFNEDPALMLLIDRRPVDLSFFELRRIVDYFTVEENPKVKPYAVRYYGILADTLVPLIILAISIPFAVSGVRVSPAVGVSKSIGLFFLYYVFSSIGTMLGNGGFMDPLWAAWLPNLAMTGLATYFFGRLR